MKQFLFLVGLSALFPSAAPGQAEKSSVSSGIMCRLYRMECPSPSSKPYLPLRKRATQQASAKNGEEMLFPNPGNWEPPFFPQGVMDGVTSIQVSGDSVLVTGKIGSRADSTKTWGVALWDGRKWTSPVTRPPGVSGWFWGFLQEGREKRFFGSYSRDSLELFASVMSSWDGSSWNSRVLKLDQATARSVGFATSLVRWKDRLIYASYVDGIWEVGDSTITSFLSRDSANILEMNVQDGKLWIRGNIHGHGFAVRDENGLSYPTLETSWGVSWAWLGPIGFFLDNQNSGLRGPSQSDRLAVLSWDGNAWSRIPLDSSMPYPRRLASDGQNLYLVGADRVVGDEISAANVLDGGIWIARWDGDKFSVVERKEFLGSIAQTALDQGRLYVGGSFNRIGELRADNLAMWDGTRWHAFTQGIQPGLAGNASDAVSWKGKLVFGGENILATGTAGASGIAAWDGTDWESFGKGIRKTVGRADLHPTLEAKVNCLAADDGNVYAGGRFDSAGGSAARNVARWDGTDWAPLAEGLPYEAAELKVANGSLFAASVIMARDTNRPDDGNVRNFSRWDGQQWRAMGSLPFGPISNLFTLYEGAVWARSDQVLVKWTGTSWDTVDVGMSVKPDNVIAHGGSLYISAFNSSQGLFKFDGRKLDTIAGVAAVDDMYSDGENLFVYGLFEIPGYPSIDLARWDGNGWLPLADLNGHFRGMTAHEDYLYVFLDPNLRGTTNYDPYLRWNRRTGTWTRPASRESKPGNRRWKILSCGHGCSLSEGVDGVKVFDLFGRKMAGGKLKGRAAAGVRVVLQGDERH